MSINRRGFLKTASVAGASLAAGMGIPNKKPCLAKPVIGKDAYWDNLDYDTDGVYFKTLKSHPGPGELHIAAPAGLAKGASAIPGYLFEPKLADKGRELYAKGIETCLKNAYAVADQCGEKARVQRLKDSLLHVMDDVSLLAYARLPAEETPELYQ